MNLNTILDRLANLGPVTADPETFAYTIRRVAVTRDLETSELVYQAIPVREISVRQVGRSMYPSRFQKLSTHNPVALIEGFADEGFESELARKLTDEAAFEALAGYCAAHALDERVARRLSESMNSALCARKGLPKLAILSGRAS